MTAEVSRKAWQRSRARQRKWGLGLRSHDTIVVPCDIYHVSTLQCQEFTLTTCSHVSATCLLTYPNYLYQARTISLCFTEKETEAQRS